MVNYNNELCQLIMKHYVHMVIYNEITLTRVKSIKCNEFISFLKSHSDLG